MSLWSSSERSALRAGFDHRRRSGRRVPGVDARRSQCPKSVRLDPQSARYSVEAVICGPPDAVADMTKACKNGPEWADVGAVTVSDEAENPHGAFTILNDR